ncbi:FAD-binding protein [Flexivirga meconopsidis]|uniref:FAD-binding protein n=1 Tax=Flexivirga meconopsidis TaxID=2977121 RepID=UPI0022403C45|nr:FAD-binding protein [Flexivirga meconopsidis]
MTTTNVSRRTMIGATAGATVLAWLPASRSWATTLPSDATAMPVPKLRGTLTTSAVDGYSHDFGGMRTARPYAVLTPAGADDIAAMIRFARNRRISVAMNGQSGETGLLESHSCLGQALTAGGVQINSRGLRTVHSVNTRVADVDAGVTWAELATAAAKVGARVPALTDYLHLSIGGTVSVGGIGGGVQRFGLQSDLVTWVEVVTGTGSIVRASATSNKALFDAVRAGAGQFGIITRLGISMAPAEQTATITTLYYDDAATFVADHVALMEADCFDHHAGSLISTDDGKSWAYSIEVGSFHTAPELPAAPAALANAKDVRSRRTTASMPYQSWAFRVDEFAAAMVSSGHWSGPKPWLNLLVTKEKVVEFLQYVETQLTPADFGAGFCIIAPLQEKTLKSPAFALGNSRSGVHFFFDMLSFPGADAPPVAEAMAKNRRIYDWLVDRGGKRYIIGAIEMSIGDWMRHFGARYTTLKSLRDRFDPSGILTPGQGMFSRSSAK